MTPQENTGGGQEQQGELVDSIDLAEFLKPENTVEVVRQTESGEKIYTEVGFRERIVVGNSLVFSSKEDTGVVTSRIREIRKFSANSYIVKTSSKTYKIYVLPKQGPLNANESQGEIVGTIKRKLGWLFGNWGQ